MGSPISLGTMFGVHVRVDLTVLLVAAVFVFMGVGAAPTAQNILNQLTFVVLLFVSIFLHEMGHATGAAIFDKPQRWAIELSPEELAKLDPETRLEYLMRYHEVKATKTSA